MTVFVLSHNLQLSSSEVPAIGASELADGLLKASDHIQSSEALNHPHWLVKVDSNLSAQEFAQELIQAWEKYRKACGHSMTHSLLALGGRKDSKAASPAAPLQQGSWGVDVVECADPDGFLKAINWDELKGGRPQDGVFEVRN